MSSNLPSGSKPDIEYELRNCLKQKDIVHEEFMKMKDAEIAFHKAKVDGAVSYLYTFSPETDREKMIVADLLDLLG